MTKVTKLEGTTNIEHCEMGASRASRDWINLDKLLVWLNMSNPFNQNDSLLHCLSSGLTATDEDGINCDTAEEVGAKVHVSIDNVGFVKVSLSKKNQMKSLINLHKSCRVVPDVGT